MRLKVDFVILVEHRARDLENACLLKYELEKRGYHVRISSGLYWRYETTLFFYTPTIVITPWLYDNQYVKKISAFRKKKPKNIVNLQCEQVFNPSILENDLYVPTGLAPYFYHISWGERRQNYLIQHHIPQENLLLAGAVSMDFTRPIFQSYYPTKQDMAERYSLDKNKKWGLFLSSFSCSKEYTDLFVKKNNGCGYSSSVMKINKLQEKTKPIILEWISQFLLEHPDYEFIYRPHPGEVTDEVLYEMAKKYKRFHVISDDSMRNWFVVCDSVNNWLSTSSFDIYFFEKNCSILRPVEIPKDLDYELLNPDHYIQDYEQFVSYQLHPNQFAKPVIAEKINEYYWYDEIPAFIKICDYLEEIYHGPQNPYIYSPELNDLSDEQLRKGWKKFLFWVYCSLSVYISFSKFLKGITQFTAKRIEKESHGIYKEIRTIEKKIHDILDHKD